MAVSMSSRTLELMDTTLRDGEQTQGVSFPPKEKLEIAKSLLGKLKVSRVEVASARVSDGEQKGVSAINEWAAENGCLNQVEVLGFVDHTKSVDWISEAGGKVINLLTKGSLKHCLGQLKKEPKVHWADVKRTISYAKEKGLTVNVYLEDWSNGYKDSVDYVYSMMAELQSEPIDRFMLPDTLGVMSPAQVEGAISDMISRYPLCHFDFHPHNDYGMATANVLAAVRAGVKGVHSTINCLGERAGNASLAEVAVNLRDHMNIDLGLDEKELIPLSRMVENFSGKRLSDNAPVVGDDVFTQTAGIHADGDQKGGLYQTHLAPERFGKKHRYALGKMAGKASLQKNLDELGFKLSAEDQKKVLSRIIAMGDNKEEIILADLQFIVADVLESGIKESIVVSHFSSTSHWGKESAADYGLLIDGVSFEGQSHGNGGFDAFMNGLSPLLEKLEIQMPTLLDYEIRIPRTGETDAMTEAIITWEGENNFITRGVHHNQVFAAVNAAVKMLNMIFNQKSQN